MTQIPDPLADLKVQVLNYQKFIKSVLHRRLFGVRDFDLEDEYSAFLVQAYSCLSGFDPNKGKLGTWIIWQLKSYVNNRWQGLTANKRQGYTFSLEQSLDKDSEEGQNATDREILSALTLEPLDERTAILKFFPEMLDILEPRWREVLQLRFVEELTLAEVGQKLGVGAERVRQIETVALKRIRVFIGLERPSIDRRRRQNYVQTCPSPRPVRAVVPSEG